jgi:two-component system, cell cycle sensor histidine kinase and response regulator CckA
MGTRTGVISVADLRRTAEASVGARKSGSGLRAGRLKHELEVRRAELETQNEELRRAQAELQESRDQYYELFDLAPIAYVTLDEAGRIVETNLTAAELLGLPRASLIGRPLQAFMEQSDADAFHRLLKRASTSSEKQSQELDLHPFTKCTMRAHVDAIGVPAQPGRPFSCRCVIADLSALRQVEHRLTESEERFRQFVEAVDDVFYIRDGDGRFVYLSPAFERTFGLRVQDDCQTASGWTELIVEEDRERLRLADERLVAEGRAYDVGYRIRRSDETRHLRHRAYPVLDRTGLVGRTVGIIHDVTVERELEEQLRHAQKMETIGALASGVAHDFNNVLQSIIGLGWMALKKDARPSEIRENVEAVVRTARRGGAVTGRLTSFARRRMTNVGRQEVDSVLQEVAVLLPHLLTEAIVIELDLGAPGVTVAADAAQLEQILMNLAANARDAMPRGGTLCIQTSVEGASVRILVSDTGCGMDPAVRAQIFEPFFTTKGAGRGTGLGLASVRALTEQLGGRVEVESEVGIGTVVTLELPVVAADLIGAPPRPTVELMDGKVLLVEDEPVVRMTIRRYLEELGLEVIEASNGEEARRRFASTSGFRLLVTDVVMPGMLGTVLAGLLQSSQPELRVLFMTANPQSIVAERSLSGRALLRKPFNKHDLACTLGELLGRKWLVGS